MIRLVYQTAVIVTIFSVIGVLFLGVTAGIQWVSEGYFFSGALTILAVIGIPSFMIGHFIEDYYPAEINKDYPR